jgi:hypothetical protein
VGRFPTLGEEISPLASGRQRENGSTLAFGESTLLSDLNRMQRRPTFRLATGCAAFAFAVTAGMTGMQMHPLSAHPESDDVLAMQMGTDMHRMSGMSEHLAHHTGQHSRHSLPGSSNDCTCLGPCQGGGPPTLAGQAAFLTVVPGTTALRVAYSPVEVIRKDPTAYLRPLPNAPPLA